MARDEYRISKFDHGLGHGHRPTWVVYDRAGGVVSGPTRSGGWANSFTTRADAEHACERLNGRRGHRKPRRD